MNSFEKFVYSILETFTSSEVGITIFLLGGFTLCVIYMILLCTPLFRGIPFRLVLIVGSALPAVVVIYGTMLDLLVRGRHTGIILALCPILLAYPPTVAAFIAVLNKKHEKRKRFIVLLGCLLIAQLWATLVIWLATNSGFMGASC